MGYAEKSKVSESATVDVETRRHEPVQWRCHTKIEKFWAGAEDVRAGRHVSSTNPVERLGSPVVPYDVREIEGNLLLQGGADLLWLGLEGGLTATTGQKNTQLDNTNAKFLVGDDNTAAAAGQTDLQASSASTDRWVGAMEATYPLHTSGDGSTAALNVQYRSIASTAVAQFTWNEWGIGNHASSTVPYPGRLVNRKVENLGVKSTGATWTATLTLSLS